MKYVITRTDDFGSAPLANKVILEAVREGQYVKNVSCMAASPFITQGAEELEILRKEKKICLGVHITLNSEWEKIHFKSVLPPGQIPSLVDEQGVFTMHPMYFAQKVPVVEEAVKEAGAQLDRLTMLGLKIEYMDTHMLPEAAVPGLIEALSEFAKEKGLIDQRWFYTFAKEHQPVLDGIRTMEEDLDAYCAWYDLMEDGKQYINILHPASYSAETRLFYNHVLTGEQVAKSRDAEQRLLCSGRLEQYCDVHEIQRITYKEAKPQGDTTMEAAKKF